MQYYILIGLGFLLLIIILTLPLIGADWNARIKKQQVRERYMTWCPNCNMFHGYICPSKKR